MAPPAVAIVIGITAVVGVTVAFHQFVYEPHLAPKFEVAIANWLDKRRRKRREAEAYRAVPDEHDDNLQDKTNDVVPPVEMDTMAKEVPGWRGAPSLTLNEAGSTSELRRRNISNRVTVEETAWTLKPEPLTPTLENQYPLTSPPLSAATISYTSTPSTIESSLLDFASPSTPLVALSPSQNVLPRTLSPDSIASQRDPLADSILSNNTHEILSSAHTSPIQSPVRISPRGLQVNLGPTSRVDEDERDTHPLSQGRHPSATRSPRSPLASTIYESFTGTQATPSPSLPPTSTLSPRATPPQFAIHSPLSDSLSLVEHPTAPASTSSWSDIGSADAEGDRGELLLGSDAESWTRARNVRRT